MTWFPLSSVVSKAAINHRVTGEHRGFSTTNPCGRAPGARLTRYPPDSFRRDRRAPSSRKPAGRNLPPAASQACCVVMEPSKPNCGCGPNVAGSLVGRRQAKIHVRMPLRDAERNALVRVRLRWRSCARCTSRRSACSRRRAFRRAATWDARDRSEQWPRKRTRSW